MALENLTNLTAAIDIIPVVNRFSNLITLFQAIGGLIIAYIIFNAISLWLGRKKAKEISKMRETLDKIDKRLEKIEKKR